MSNDEIVIFKEPVLYMIVKQCKTIDSDTTFISTEPVMMNTCDYPDTELDGGETIFLEKNVVVLGIVPAPIGMFEVKAGLPGKSSLELLGYEYPGGEHKDWIETAKDAIKWGV